MLRIDGNVCRLEDWKTFAYKRDIPFEDKLRLIRRDLRKLLRVFRPAVTVLESQFFSKNVRTLRVLSQAAGAMKLCVIVESSSDVVEFSPRQIKMAATGKGNATKDEVRRAVQEMFGVKDLPEDAADAIACALAWVLSDLDGPKAIFDSLPEEEVDERLRALRNFIRYSKRPRFQEKCLLMRASRLYKFSGPAEQG